MYGWEVSVNGSTTKYTKKLQMSMDDMMEMAEALSGAMTPEDLEQLKVKHRSDEARDILKADLKYLKALFDRLQSEKESVGKSSMAGNFDSGVILSLGGADIPVADTVQQNTPVEVGGSFDVEV